MFDVFYMSRPTGLFAHERPAADLEDAAEQSRTRYFWLLDGRDDYTDFDFHWLPTKWENHNIHAFVSQWNRTYAFFSPKYPQGVRIEHVVYKKASDPIYYIDHSNPESDQRYRNLVSQRLDVRRIDSAQSILELVKISADRQSNAWFVDSRIDYTDFDFSWHPSCYDDWLRVFGRNTLYVSVDTFETQRLDSPATRFVKIKHCRDQLPRIDSTLAEQPLDIVYVSNREIDAEKWWKHLQKITSNAENRLLRVADVQGRTQALRRAAELSCTPWFFVVPAKLEMSADFDWSWQPDSHLWPCHYVFYCRNPVNGLEYGHMAMVAYNRELVLDTTEPVLDFTMSRPYTVVPQVIGTAHYNAEPEMAWRTAFREVIKLKSSAEKGDQVSAERLACWLSLAQGINAEWSQRGAQDGVDYYNQVSGDLDRLLDTYHWSWLDRRFKSLYPG